ncbi:MAG: sensor histidine kinase [Anaerolineae bacterium]
MRQAISNLLSNAVKYSPAGGTIRLQVACEPDALRIQVSDQGIGIPEEDQKRLFEVFHRAGNVGTVPGMGLGLVITKRAVEVHGGTVTFTSKVGEGTTFIITIPTENPEPS